MDALREMIRTILEKQAEAVAWKGNAETVSDWDVEDVLKTLAAFAVELHRKNFKKEG